MLLHVLPLNAPSDLFHWLLLFGVQWLLEWIHYIASVPILWQVRDMEVQCACLVPDLPMLHALDADDR